MVHGNGAGCGPDQVWILKRVSIVAGNDFRDAEPSQDENGRPDITFNLTSERATASTPSPAPTSNKMMAIVLNDRVREAATIESGIRDSGRITGGFSPERRRTSRSRCVPARCRPRSTHWKSAASARRSAQPPSAQGVIAAVAGMLAVMVFMLIYYRGAGINADLALFLNLVILLGFMGFTGSTLTLPGIAGVILTIGMGVDSNVLIFERIREELHTGQARCVGRRPGLRARLDHHHRHARHDHRLGGDPVPLRHRSGARLRRHADLRSAGEPLHRCLCLARHLRLDPRSARNAARHYRSSSSGLSLRLLD